MLTCTYPKVLKTYSDSCRSATKIQSAVNKTVVLTRDAARMEKLPRKSHVIIIIRLLILRVNTTRMTSNLLVLLRWMIGTAVTNTHTHKLPAVNHATIVITAQYVPRLTD